MIGAMIGTVATITQAAGPLTVNHQGQVPAVTISFNLAPAVALGEAIDQIRDMEQRRFARVGHSTQILSLRLKN